MPYAVTLPHEYKTALPKCVIRIDDGWYDCTAWRHSHPGGVEFIDRFHQMDATDAFYSLHSVDAIARLKRMKATPANDADPPRDKLSANFEAFRKELEQKGFFDRHWTIDFCYSVLPVLVMCVVGTMISYSYPVIASLLIGLSMQQAGWIGHDYSHGRGALCDFLGKFLGGFINGFSCGWWRNKHDTHHIYPNRIEYDSDIHNEPILYLWLNSECDGWHRRYQHMYYLFAYSLLFVSWRLQSIQFVLGSKDWVERGLLILDYIWLACLPWKVAVASIIIGGFSVAIVVTANHQTEEIIAKDDAYHFINDQFRTTRGVICRNFFSEYFFGGMQYQLEHHLFPIMPRYRYPELRPLVREFAKKNGLQYHMETVWDIMVLNYRQMEKIARGEVLPPKSKAAN